MFSSWNFESISDLASSIKNKIEQAIEQTKHEFEEEEKKVEERQIEKERQQKIQQDNCPPWSVWEEDKSIVEEELKSRIFKLSQDERVFLVESPDDELFPFQLPSALKYALPALEEDSGLNVIRYKLVPKRISEDRFWRNYFYRVSLLREQFNVEPLLLTPSNERPLVPLASSPSRHSPPSSPSSSSSASPLPPSTIVSHSPAPASPEPLPSNSHDTSASDVSLESHEPKTPYIPPSLAHNNDDFRQRVKADLEELDDAPEPEFISDDFVHVGLQNALLVDKIKEELGLNDKSSSGLGLSPELAAGDLDLADLQSMVADVDGADIDEEILEKTMNDLKVSRD